MANDVIINVKANTSQAQSAMGTFGRKLDEVVRGVTGFSLASIGTVGAVTGIVNAVRQGVDEWQNYALSSKDASAAIGVTVEDFTRLVQVADDARLSQASLTTALQMMAKNGVAPSIDNLAKLADELRGLSVTDRAAKLSELFGRNWREVYKILEDGGQALKDNTKAVADGLVVTGKAADEAEDYFQAVDQLNDSIAELKNGALKDIIPLLTQGVTTMNGVTRANKEATDWWVRLAYAIPGVGIALQALDGKFYQTRDANEAALATVRQMPDALSAMEGSAQGAAAGIAAIGDEAQSTGERLRTHLEGAYRNIHAAQKDLEDATASFGEKIGGDLKSQFEAAGVKGDELRTVLGYIDQNMGTAYQPTMDLERMTPELVTAYLNGGRDAEAFNQKLRDQLAPMQALYQPIVDARVALQEMRAELETLTGKVWAIQIDYGSGPASLPEVTSPTKPKVYDPLTGTFHKDGGSYMVPGGYNENYPVGPGHYASSGEVVTITPASQVGWQNGGQKSSSGITINNLYLSLSGVTNVQQFMAELGRLANNARNAGRAYQGA